MKVSILFLISFFFLSTARAADSIPVGERLVYQMSWMGVPIGTGELWAKEKTVLNGKEVFHVVGTMRTNNVLSTIYPVRNEIHSWIDAETLNSVKFEKNISEGPRKLHEVVEFDRPMHDVVSVFYWVRRQALTPGESARTVVFEDKKEWTVEAKVMKRETLQLREWGPTKTLLVEPRSKTEGIPEKKGKSLMNLSDDDSKKPLKITYKAPFGRMSGYLMKNKESAS